MDLGLDGKTVLITGGSKGIGLACALAFAAEGCNLRLAARNPQLLESARRSVLERPAVNGPVKPVCLRDVANAQK